MRMTDLISKKRDGGELSGEEINFMIQGYTQGEIPDYQMSAMCMAILFRGMNDREILDLTMSMMHSGDVMDLSAIDGVKADKHSTGGVGDKHVDLFWGIWSLQFNLHTNRYRERFLDVYGREGIEEELLRIIGAIEVFG